MPGSISRSGLVMLCSLFLTPYIHLSLKECNRRKGNFHILYSRLLLLFANGWQTGMKQKIKSPYAPKHILKRRIAANFKW